MRDDVDVDELLRPIVEALADGKAIQCDVCDEVWEDTDRIYLDQPLFNKYGFVYRIKPEPELERPILSQITRENANEFIEYLNEKEKIENKIVYRR